MVSSVGSNYSAVSSYTTRTRPDPAELASKLFSKLDTKGQGYIQESDLESAFNQVYSSASSSSSSTATDSSSSASASSQASTDATQLFSALDSDGNGQVTESEFSSGLQKLADALDSQAFSSRMQGAGGMPPPPPPGDGGVQNDTGFTKDQLTSQLQAIGSTDSERSGVISDVVNNFDKADTDGDGKVTLQEAMAYEQSQSTTSSASASATATSSTDSASAVASSSVSSHHDGRMMHRLMELMRTYGSNSGTSDGTSSASSITVSA